jgi:hypothetical protein
MGQEPEDIRREIAATRARMSDTIEALASRLDPKAKVVDALEGSSNMVRGMGEVAREFVEEFKAQRKRHAHTL